MKDRLSFLWQIIFSVVLSFGFGSGFIAVLTLFRERLSELQYNLFLFAVYVFFIIMLVVLSIVLIRFAFGDWLGKLSVSIKDYREHRGNLKVANRLFDKWLDLSKLIEEVITIDCKPNEDQKSKYFDLHLWFTVNRSQYLSSWYNFDRLRTDMAHDSIYWDSTRDIGYEVFKNNYRDPFSYFYAPLSIEHLCHILERRPVGEARIVMSKLTELTLEFVRWTRLK